MSLLQIREQDPLKQGLKQNGNPGNGFPLHIREQDPLKQGLKQSQKSHILIAA